MSKPTPIEHLFFVTNSRRDSSGNSYSYFSYIHAPTGKTFGPRFAGLSPVSNIKCVPRILSGGEWKQNYNFLETEISIREFDKKVGNMDYISCSPEVIAEEILKVINS